MNPVSTRYLQPLNQNRTNTNHGPGCKYTCFCYIPGINSDPEPQNPTVGFNDLLRIPYNNLYAAGRIDKFNLIDSLVAFSGYNFKEHLKLEGFRRPEFQHESCRKQIRNHNYDIELQNHNQCQKINQMMMKDDRFHYENINPESPNNQNNREIIKQHQDNNQNRNVSINSNNQYQSAVQTIPGQSLLLKHMNRKMGSAHEQLVATKYSIALENHDVVPGIEFKNWTPFMFRLLARKTLNSYSNELGKPCDFCKLEIKVEDDYILRLECGHQFHKECIMEWLKKSMNCGRCYRSLNLGRRELSLKVEKNNESEDDLNEFSKDEIDSDDSSCSSTSTVPINYVDYRVV